MPTQPHLLQTLAGVIVLALAIWAVVRKVDVRVSLGAAALALGLIAGRLDMIAQTFLGALSDPKFVVPICCAMGFAYVLKETECDLHLVRLLTNPLRRVQSLLVPGAVLVGFVVNIPVISQTGAAVAVGSVLIPLLRAAGLSAVTSGGALLLGCSMGGELLNPGAPEYAAIGALTHTAGTASVAASVRLVLPALAAAVAVFWWLSRREKRSTADDPVEVEPPGEAVRVRLLKAAVPLLPLALLLVVGEPLRWLPIPKEWLTDKETAKLFESRLIGAAMLVGVFAASLTMLGSSEERAKCLGVGKAFFEGAGYAFKEIVALIVVAQCFGKGVELVGVGALVGHAAALGPALILPAAAILPALFAVLCGSGIASTQVLFKFFFEPAVAAGLNPVQVGSMVSLGAAAGRTMSPVAAVVLMSAKLSGADPIALVRRVAPCLCAGLLAALISAWWG